MTKTEEKLSGTLVAMLCTVCLNCLETLTTDKTYFMCPECRTEHIVLDQGVKNIMDNEAMARLIETRQVSASLTKRQNTDWAWLKLKIRGFCWNSPCYQ